MSDDLQKPSLGKRLVTAEMATKILLAELANPEVVKVLSCTGYSAATLAGMLIGFRDQLCAILGDAPPGA